MSVMGLLNSNLHRMFNPNNLRLVRKQHYACYEVKGHYARCEVKGGFSFYGLRF